MRIVQYALFISFLVLSFYNCHSIKKSASPEKEFSYENILANYGEEIYKRENCGSCHTQQIDQATSTLISLDGLGGKYASTWLYYFFEDPKLLIPDGEMPGFRHLYNKQIEKEKAVAFLAEKHQNENINTDTAWLRLISQTELIAEDINQKGVKVKSHKEVLALIAYLQTIPATENFKQAYILKQEEYEKEKINWESIIESNFSSIINMEENHDNILGGKKLFKSNCSMCHGDEGGGYIGPNLTDEYWLHGGTKLDITKTIVYGVAEKGMIPWRHQLKPEEVGKLVAFISALKGTQPKDPKKPQGVKSN